MLEKQAEVEKQFGKGIEDAESEAYIETFMQNIVILIDNSELDQQTTMLSILAKLSTIKYQSFGQ